jgi:tRNA (cytidine/uridine-2'-O-)-methyltransferase
MSDAPMGAGGDGPALLGDDPAAPLRGDMKVVLVTPEIPGNTGTIGRTCVALDLELILIRPYGFDISDKSVRRAGLDYWKHVRLSEYDDWAGFVAQRAPRRDQMFLFEEHGTGGTVYDPVYPADAYLVFGRETKGLQPEIVAGMEDRIFRLPMRSRHIRSLNLANAATAVVYQAMRDFLA